MPEFEKVNVKSLKVVELREELEKRGLDTKGLKKDVSRAPSPGRSLTDHQLADRLSAAQDLGISGGSELAPLTEEAKEEAAPPKAPDEEVKKPVKRGRRSNKETKADEPDEDLSANVKVDEDDDVGPNEEMAEVEKEVEKGAGAREAARPDTTMEDGVDRPDLDAPNGGMAEDEAPDESMAPAAQASDEKPSSTSSDLPPPAVDSPGVGHVMVQGSPERATEVHMMPIESDLVKVASTEPAALKDETAKDVAMEEVKAARPSTPSPPRVISPMPAASSQSKQEGVPTSDARDGDMDVEYDNEPPIRAAPAVASSSKLSAGPTLPPALSHLKHVPTSTLYITDLRRPLTHSALHAHLFDADLPSLNRLPPARNPFASEEYPNLWLSGVKSHAYAAYDTAENALSAAERIEGVKFPEETGDSLHVQFVRDAEVLRLVQQEEEAWSDGRRKLDLMIEKDESGEIHFELRGSGSVGGRAPVGGGATAGGGGGMAPRPLPMPGRLGMGLPISGPNALPTRPAIIRPPPPTGPASVRPPLPVGIHPSRAGLVPGAINGARQADDARQKEWEARRDENERAKLRRLENPMRRTQVRPRLFWKKGPGGANRSSDAQPMEVES